VKPILEASYSTVQYTGGLGTAMIPKVIIFTSFLYRRFKGQCHEIFCFWFFMNQFPPRTRVSYLDRFGPNGSRAWGKLIHETNQKSKISSHCPFKADLLNFDCLEVLSNMLCGLQVIAMAEAMLVGQYYSK
jgi:hypothetical protein